MIGARILGEPSPERPVLIVSDVRDGLALQDLVGLPIVVGRGYAAAVNGTPCSFGLTLAVPGEEELAAAAGLAWHGSTGQKTPLLFSEAPTWREFIEQDRDGTRDLIERKLAEAGARIEVKAKPAQVPAANAVSKKHPGAQASGNAGTIVYTRADAVPVQPIKWLWPGRIARGKVSLIAGHPGLGKSQLTASLAAVVSTGGCWPIDRTPCTPGNVLILSAEDDASDTIVPRLKAAGADLTRVFLVEAVTDGFTADGTEARRLFNLGTDLKRLGDMLKKVGGAAMVVIDPVSAYLGAADSHRNSDVRALLAPLGELAAEHGTAVVAVSHLNKGSGSEAIGRVTGSMAFVAAARSTFVVARDPENDARRLFLPLKNNLGNDSTGLAFKVEGHEFESNAGAIQTSRVVWDGTTVSLTADEALRAPTDSDEKSTMEDAKQFLKGLLANGPVPTKQIQVDADGAGYAWATIRRAQQALGVLAEKDGMKGPWRWALPSATAEDAHEDAHTQR